MTLPDPRLSVFDAGPPVPCPARINLAAYVLAGGARDRVALRVLDGDGAVDWQAHALEAAVRRVAAGLRQAGLRSGERVALRIGNSVDFPLLFFGTIAAGGVAAVLSTQLTAAELTPLLAEIAPRLVVTTRAEGMPESTPRLVIAGWEEIASDAPGEIADTGAEDPAFLIYTSGTGGRPKGVLHAQRAGWARRMMWDGWYGLGPGDRVLHAGAFNWTYTLGAGLIDPWAAGAMSLVYTGRSDPALWPRLAQAEGATIFAAVPGVYRQMLRTGDDLGQAFRCLRHGLSAGEALPEALRTAWQAATGTPIYEALGMSEVSTYVSSSPTVPHRPGTAGRPQIGRRVAVVDPAGQPVPLGDEGVLAVARRDPGLMLGYWQRPAETAESFRGEWFLTGDRARMDADGYITHLGRADEVMTALGYRVSPAEVEAAMEPHPAVAEIAVAELPVRADLKLIAAFVRPVGPWPGEEALEIWAAERLAPYKRPRIWIQVDALPRTQTGKLVRSQLIASHRRDL
ncbi:MAG: acyl-CoA synthetase [Pikeienuella sp.]